MYYAEEKSNNITDEGENEVDENDESNFLQGFHWLDGDSLAPPCQADLQIVHSILDLAGPYLSSAQYNTSSTEASSSSGATAVVTASTEQLVAREIPVLYDLGCGDGRICTEASKRFSCHSVGIEIEPHLIQKFHHNVQLLQLEDKVTIIEGDLLDINIQHAAVVVVYLLPESIEKISKKLITVLQHGGVVICNTWGIKSLSPLKKITTGPSNNCDLFLYDHQCLIKS